MPHPPVLFYAHTRARAHTHTHTHTHTRTHTRSARDEVAALHEEIDDLAEELDGARATKALQQRQAAEAEEALTVELDRLKRQLSRARAGGTSQAGSGSSVLGGSLGATGMGSLLRSAKRPTPAAQVAKHVRYNLDGDDVHSPSQGGVQTGGGGCRRCQAWARAYDYVYDCLASAKAAHARTGALLRDIERESAHVSLNFDFEAEDGGMGDFASALPLISVERVDDDGDDFFGDADDSRLSASAASSDAGGDGYVYVDAGEWPLFGWLAIPLIPPRPFCDHCCR